MSDTLAFGFPGVPELVIILLVFSVPVLLIILFARYGLRNRRENVRLRLEVSKLADELEQARKQKKQDEKDSSAGESG